MTEKLCAIGAFFGDAPVDQNALLVGQLGPARDLLKRAVATAAHIIAQRGGAMPDAGAFRCDFLLD